MQRLKLKQIKKEIAEEFQNDYDLDEVKAKLNKFQEEVKAQNTEYLLNKIKLAAPEIEKNSMDDKKIILFFENDKNALKEYFEKVVMTRPKMIPEVKTDFPYDWDFEVDLDKYDPWNEYKLIYKDLLHKGRAYYILKSIPEWRFLQISRPNGDPIENISNYNPKRPNYRDSIFHMITNDRYFTERERKEGTYRGYSQAVRI